MVSKLQCCVFDETNDPCSKFSTTNEDRKEEINKNGWTRNNIKNVETKENMKHEHK